METTSKFTGILDNLISPDPNQRRSALWYERLHAIGRPKSIFLDNAKRAAEVGYPPFVVAPLKVLLESEQIDENRAAEILTTAYDNLTAMRHRLAERAEIDGLPSFRKMHLEDAQESESRAAEIRSSVTK